jgi:hypothetical protein
MGNKPLENTMKALSTLALALSGAVVAVAAPAEAQFADLNAAAPYTQAERIGGVEVVNGGGSEDDVNHIKSIARSYPLQFIISGRGGEYGVADTLTLRNASGEVVSVADAGPYVLMKVPPGRYTAEAVFDGQTERRSVTVGSSHATVHWNTPRASD